ncbi:MAG: hypothetical protein AMS14_10275 [Planctomycetes bacterium DG_20]|nr:MAG: hypothetical protein AMS14_10275 [Planctomycetes bacterium DG_20]
MRAAKPMPDIRDLRLFDSCMTLGRGVLAGCPEWLTRDNVLAVMDRYDIAEALVHDHHARFVYPREEGNRRLLESVRGIGRLYPVWVLEPPRTPGFSAAAAVVTEMLEAGVRAARLAVKAVPPMAWLWDDLCAALEEHRVPSFLDFGEATTRATLSDSDVAGVRDIALAHPELPLILSHIFGGLGVHPALLPLIRRVPNVYIDITGVLEYWREVARDVGPGRVLFATGAPFCDPGILISNVQYARALDQTAKRMICGDNLRGLLDGVR